MIKNLKKVLFFILSSFIGTGHLYAMDNKCNFDDYQSVEKIITKVLESGQKIGSGEDGTVYLYPMEEYQNLAVKFTYAPIDRRDAECLETLKCSKLGENLAKVFYVSDNKKCIISEYINGISCKKICDLTSKLKDKNIELDFFIEKWCIGLLNGLNEIFKLTRRYLTDRNLKNFVIKSQGNNFVPVHIDYDFNFKSPSEFKPFKELFLAVMESNVEKDKDEKKYDALYNYIKSIKDGEMLYPHVIESIIDDLRKMKENKCFPEKFKQKKLDYAAYRAKFRAFCEKRGEYPISLNYLKK